MRKAPACSIAARMHEPASPDAAACIVLDMDWAHDAVLEHTLELIERLELPVTMYVTHATPMLDQLRASGLVELGIHPNFNDLLQGTAPDGASARERVAALMNLVPEARSVRSHSLTVCSWLMYVFADAGLTHEVNMYLPLRAGMSLRAWRNWDDRLIRVPFLFEDSLQSHMREGWDVHRHLEHAGLRVLNFHPIRLFLNWRDATLPADAAAPRQDPQRLGQLRRPADEVGSATFLEQFVEAHRRRGGEFTTISSIVADSDVEPAAARAPGVAR